MIFAALINKSHALFMKFSLKKRITGSKISIFSRSGATQKMNKGHDEPKAFNAFCRTDLVLIKSQNVLALTEKHLDRPSFGVNIQNLFGRQGSVGANKSTQSSGFTKSVLGVIDWRGLHVNFVHIRHT